LVKTIYDHITDGDKEFLLSFKKGNPNWRHLGIDHIEHLPSVRWKLFNLDKMDKEKRQDAIGKLQTILYDR